MTNLIPFFIVIFLYACTNDPNVVQEFVENKELPVEETENAEILVTNDGKLRVKISSESIKRFENNCFNNEFSLTLITFESNPD